MYVTFKKSRPDPSDCLLLVIIIDLILIKIFNSPTHFQITKLKIDSNPFAKGFRDSGRLSDLEKEKMEDLMETRNGNLVEINFYIMSD